MIPWSLISNPFLNLYIARVNKAGENSRFSFLLFATGDVSRGGRLSLSGRNSILMTKINVYLINPEVMGFQMQICLILRFSLSILVLCSSATSRKDYILQILTILLFFSFHFYFSFFLSYFFHFAFVAFCPLYVIREQ